MAGRGRGMTLPAWMTAQDHDQGATGIDNDAKTRSDDKSRERIEMNAIVQGRVARITNFGAFVNLKNGCDGLVHISELQNGYCEKVEDVVKIDDIVRVKVIKIDGDRISLSIKRAIPPSRIGSIVRGTVLRVVDYGCFVELDETGESGLVHISDLASYRVDKVRDVIDINQRVFCKVLDPSERGLKLSMRAVDQATGIDLSTADQKKIQDNTPLDLRRDDREVVLDATNTHFAQEENNITLDHHIDDRDRKRQKTDSKKIKKKYDRKHKKKKKKSKKKRHEDHKKKKKHKKKHKREKADKEQDSEKEPTFEPPTKRIRHLENTTQLHDLPRQHYDNTRLDPPHLSDDVQNFQEQSMSISRTNHHGAQLSSYKQNDHLEDASAQLFLPPSLKSQGTEDASTFPPMRQDNNLDHRQQQIPPNCREDRSSSPPNSRRPPSEYGDVDTDHHLPQAPSHRLTNRSQSPPPTRRPPSENDRRFSPPRRYRDYSRDYGHDSNTNDKHRRRSPSYSSSDSRSSYSSYSSSSSYSSRSSSPRPAFRHTRRSSPSHSPSPIPRRGGGRRPPR